VLRDGTLVGQRDLREKPNTDPNQAWLYTKQNFREFDLEMEWWTRFGGNSGISIRDSSRARHTFGAEADPKRTPARIGHEIQISNGYSDSYPTGSIYLFQKARTGVQIENDWNRFEIAVRDSSIRVRLNGQLVAEHANHHGRPCYSAHLDSVRFRADDAKTWRRECTSRDVLVARVAAAHATLLLHT
jgi:hypothetical protein